MYVNQNVTLVYDYKYISCNMGQTFGNLSNKVHVENTSCNMGQTFGNLSNKVHVEREINFEYRLSKDTKVN